MIDIIEYTIDEYKNADSKSKEKYWKWRKQALKDDKKFIVTKPMNKIKYIKNREQRKIAHRLYYIKNRDKVLGYSKKYREIYRDKVLGYSKKYYEKNKDKILEKNRARRLRLKNE